MCDVNVQGLDVIRFRFNILALLIGADRFRCCDFAFRLRLVFCLEDCLRIGFIFFILVTDTRMCLDVPRLWRDRTFIRFVVTRFRIGLSRFRLLGIGIWFDKSRLRLVFGCSDCAFEFEWNADVA